MFNKYLFRLSSDYCCPAELVRCRFSKPCWAASAYNAEFNAARRAHEADAQKKYQGFAGLLPVVTLNAAWNKTDQPDAAYSAGVTRHNYSFNLTQPVFDVARYANWRKPWSISDLGRCELPDRASKK
ncbi:type I secretion outer membrane protein, TolC family [Raoultella planticola]|uniref:Type I secretion outer membrane protein, TolC family n=1 Tax=Raoultella planticola TaxID=575 RepID=A0A485D0Z5_RAOPL|nr:type I secretion outer membrane protein, TolC family [Raoultella planticola]